PEHGPLDLWERNAEATARALPEVEVSDVEARVAQVVKERRAELHGQNLNRRCSELEIHDGRVRPDERLGPVPAQAIGTAQRNQRIQVVQIAIEKESIDDDSPEGEARNSGSDQATARGDRSVRLFRT